MSSSRARFLAAVASIGTIAAATAVHAQTYSRIVSFGDSLTDKGSLSPPPPPPYFQGRFSNGPTWVERLGFDNVAGYGGPVTGNVNYALGGATTGFSSPPTAGMRIQYQTYLGNGGAFGSGDLATLWGGTNDLLNSLPSALKSQDPASFMSVVADGAADEIQFLADDIGAQGAGTVLTVNLPDLGAVPGSKPPAAAVLSAGSSAFDSMILGRLQTVAAAHPSTNYILMDVARLYGAVNADPSAFGFVSNGGCFINGVVCSNPDSYFYWDSLHPSSAGHELIARLADDYLYYGDRGAASALEGEAGISNRLRSLNAALDLASPSPAAAPHNGLGVQVDGEDDDVAARALVSRAKNRDGDVRIFFDHGVGDVRFGVVGGFGEGDVRAGPFDFDETNYGGDVYGGWSSDKAFVSASAGAGHMRYHVHRATGVGPLVQTATTNAMTWGGAVQAGLYYPLGDWRLSPRVQVSFSHVQVDGYQESGVSADYAYAPRSVSSTVLDAVVRAEHPLGVGSSAFVEAGFEDAAGYGADAVVTSIADNTALPLARQVGKPYAGEGVLGAGLSWRVASRVDVQAEYAGRFGDLTSHGGRVAVKVVF
jgi:outer membrane lipase/esterase